MGHPKKPPRQSPFRRSCCIESWAQCVEGRPSAASRSFETRCASERLRKSTARKQEPATREIGGGETKYTDDGHTYHCFEGDLIVNSWAGTNCNVMEQIIRLNFCPVIITWGPRGLCGPWSPMGPAGDQQPTVR